MILPWVYRALPVLISSASTSADEYISTFFMLAICWQIICTSFHLLIMLIDYCSLYLALAVSSEELDNHSDIIMNSGKSLELLLHFFGTQKAFSSFSLSSLILMPWWHIMFLSCRYQPSNVNPTFFLFSLLLFKTRIRWIHIGITFSQIRFKLWSLPFFKKGGV